MRLRARRFVSSSRIRYFFVLREKIRADSRWTRETRATHAVRRYARDKYGHLYIHDDDDDMKTLFRYDVLRAMNNDNNNNNLRQRADAFHHAQITDAHDERNPHRREANLEKLTERDVETGFVRDASHDDVRARADEGTHPSEIGAET